MTIALYQSVSQEVSNDARPHSLAFGSDNLAGSLLLDTVNTYNAAGDPTISTPTDLRNTYTAAVADQSSGVRAHLRTYYVENCGAGANIVLNTETGGNAIQNFIFNVISEFTGVATSSSVDNTSSAGVTNDAAPNTGTVSLGSSGDMVYSALQPYNSPDPTETDTLIAEASGSAWKASVQYRLGAAPGSNNATWSLSVADPWVCHFIAFKAAAGGGATSLPPIYSPSRSVRAGIRR